LAFYSTLSGIRHTALTVVVAELVMYMCLIVEADEAYLLSHTAALAKWTAVGWILSPPCALAGSKRGCGTGAIVRAGDRLTLVAEHMLLVPAHTHTHTHTHSLSYSPARKQPVSESSATQAYHVRMSPMLLSCV